MYRIITESGDVFDINADKILESDKNRVKFYQTKPKGIPDTYIGEMNWEHIAFLAESFLEVIPRKTK